MTKERISDCVRLQRTSENDEQRKIWCTQRTRRAANNEHTLGLNSVEYDVRTSGVQLKSIDEIAVLY